MESYEDLLKHVPDSVENIKADPPPECPGEEKIEKLLAGTDVRENMLLNEAVHSGELSVFSPLAEKWVEKIEMLVRTGLILPVSPGGFRVAREIVFHPHGPGRRIDQPAGCLHRLPGEVRSQWLKSFGLKNNHRGLVKLAEEIYSAEPAEAELEYLAEKITDGPIIEKSEIAGVPEDLEDFYSSLASCTKKSRSLIAAGFLLPLWDENNRITKFVVAERLQPRLGVEYEGVFRSRAGEITPPEIDSAEKGQWSRHPFRLSEQLKMLLILADALPFRSTENDYPHRFDINEATRLLGWEKEHCYLLLDLLLDFNLLAAEEERYYLTEKTETTSDDFGVSLSETCINLVNRVRTEDSFEPYGCDFSAGKIFLELRENLNSSGLEPGEIITGQLARGLWRHLATAPGLGEDIETMALELLSTVLKSYYWFGGADVRKDDGFWEIKLNEYGRGLPADIKNETAGETMPFILQEDGTMMIPLDSSLKEFRSVNPFALLVGMDRLIEYKIDKQALVEALNGGWDIKRFKSFIAGKNGRLPSTLESLFDEVGVEGETVIIREAYHLLEFERGATAAEAMSVLSNYDPRRLAPEKILLGKKTSEETIRRNLSRAGIKMAGTDDKLREISPLVELN